jgi:signal transduction histidine kinase
MTARATLPESPRPAADEPATALAAVWLRLRQHATRKLVFMVVLCLSIALLLAAIDGGRLPIKMVYSFAIGLCCVTLTDAGRLALAWLSDRTRRARGLPPSAAGLATGWGGVLPGVLAGMTLGPVTGMALADWLTGNRSPSLLQFDSGASRFTLAISALATLASIFVLSTLERLASARALAEAAQRQAAEHQLRLLQSQLEPHMLFNTLANLRVLITLDPPRAQAMLDRLIAFLRATLQASRTERHALQVEFDRLADYLALMAVRMGPRLQVMFDLPEALQSLPVPPLLLQSLVENCIHHGLEPKVEGGRVEVRARADGDMLRLTVRDTGVGLPAGGAVREGSFGIAQVRERLATLYGEHASLQIEPAADTEGGTLATIRLPIPLPQKTRP